MSPEEEDLLARARKREAERDIPGAIEDYGLLLSRTPDDPGLLLERGRLRLLANEDEAARADFENAVKLRPGDAKILYYLAYARAQNDPAAALADYREAAKAEPRDAEGFYYRGLTFLALSEGDKAHADFRAAAEKATDADPRREIYVQKAADTEPFNLGKRIREAPVTWGLMALNVGIMLVFQELLLNPSVENAMRRGALERGAVQSGDVWRLLTACFLHFGLPHLALNVWGGLSICAPVEKALGGVRFLAVYLACGVGASAVSLLGHHVVGAGASGALFGVDGVLLVMLYRQRQMTGSWAVDRRIRRTIWSMAVWFFIGLFANLDNWAHGGGLAFGVLFGALLVPGARPPSRPAWGAAALLWIGVVAASILGLPNPARDRAEAVASLIRERETQGDYAGAERAASEAMGTGLNDRWLRIARAGLRQRQRNWDGAWSDYAELVKATEDVDGLWGLGSLAARDGRHAEALGYYDRALAVEPGSYNVLGNRGLSLAALGRTEEAARSFRRALDLAPSDWAYREMMSEALRDLQR